MVALRPRADRGHQHRPRARSEPDSRPQKEVRVTLEGSNPSDHLANPEPEQNRPRSGQGPKWDGDDRPNNNEVNSDNEQRVASGRHAERGLDVGTLRCRHSERPPGGLNPTANSRSRTRQSARAPRGLALAPRADSRHSHGPHTPYMKSARTGSVSPTDFGLEPSGEIWTAPQRLRL